MINQSLLERVRRLLNDPDVENVTDWHREDAEMSAAADANKGE